MEHYNNVVYCGVTFPNNIWGILENKVINNIKGQISNAFPMDKNLFINGTWFGPRMDNDVFNEVIDMTGNFDNVFFLTTVDPTQISVPEIIQLFHQFGSPTIYFLGNFDHSPHEFNFISWAITQQFKDYTDDEIKLTNIKYKFINYNRKPTSHRTDLVTRIIAKNLNKHAVVTLGASNDTDMHVSIKEKNEDFVETGHWFDLDDTSNDFGIPHDLLSLGDMKYWKDHFMNVVSETIASPYDPIFVTEKTFKPIIGKRPFIINGNPRTYAWLRKHGFKTFTHYFPFSDLESTNENTIVSNIIKVLQWIDNEPNCNLLDISNDMIPALNHNKLRFYEFANEQNNKLENLF